VVTLDFWIEAVVKVLFVFLVVLTAVAYMVLLERRVLAFIQARIGPNRVGYQGLLQPAADALKLMTKETVVPEAADRTLFLFAPIFGLVPALTTFSVIPFGDSITLFGREVALHITDVNVAVLFVLAMSSIGVYGIFLGGWSSNNKYALVGGLRSSAQMISYELTLGLVVVSVVVLSGSFSLVDIVNAQRGTWFIAYQPLGFLLFLVASMAEINRIPFDLPEAETELVAGFHTEYSGMRFAMYFLGEYANLMTVTALTTLLFLGGWLVPWPSPAWAAPLWFVGKMMILILFMMWTRGTLPRFRFDQLMQFGWKVLLPLALFNILATGLIVALLS
jgi:NADH-quinone oxidoreductase subunit H